MRAPGNASANPGFPGLRLAMATRRPVAECGSAAVKAWAIEPGPMMPQAVGLSWLISLRLQWFRVGMARRSAGDVIEEKAVRQTSGLALFLQVGLGWTGQDRGAGRGSAAPEAGQRTDTDAACLR